jgi:PhnB protein
MLTTANNISRVTNIHSYLTFNGNCREAMMFYKKCLGGKLSMQSIGESPLSEKMPEKMKRNILHATLQKNGFILMASDMVSEKGLRRGNSVSMVLNCSSRKEASETYKKLSEDGVQSHPLEKTFWGAVFGDLTDKYGNHWLIHYQNNKNHDTEI